MLNKIVVMGRLTRDPELRRTQSGLSVTSFSVACDRDFKNQSGEKETDFIDCVAWRNTAEFVCKYFSKGRMAVVEGRCSFATGRTITATSAGRLRLWPTMFTSGTPSAMETADISRAAMRRREAIPHRAKASAPRAVLMALLPVDIPHRITAGALRNSARMTENCRSE